MAVPGLRAMRAPAGQEGVHHGNAKSFAEKALKGPEPHGGGVPCTTQQAALGSGWSLKRGKRIRFTSLDCPTYLADGEDLLLFSSQSLRSIMAGRQVGLEAAEEWWRLFTSWRMGKQAASRSQERKLPLVTGCSRAPPPHSATC